MQYKIITDTCCDFPAHMYQELDLAAVPLSVQFRGTYYESYTEEWLKENGKTLDELLHAGVGVGVIWQDGRQFSMDNTIRMNLAVPHSLVVEAMDRLKKYVF